MICARCGERTEATPCAACGEAPLLDGRYRLEAVLAERSVGATFRATRVADGVVVVVKELRVQAGQADKRQELFEREARILRQLGHPAVPRYVDDFVVASGRWRVLCLVQEHVEGISLADLVATRRTDQAEVSQVLAEILAILADLHALSPPVVHRDVKPENVLRRPDGRLALIDFGSVRDALADPDLGGSTVAGTFGYMAPEQLAGDASERSDLYAAAATAVALLTRQEPHALIDRSREWHWERHAQVHPAFAHLLRRMLAADLEQRPASAREALEELRAVREKIRAEPDLAAPPPAPRRRFPTGPVLLGLAVLLAVPVLTAVVRPRGAAPGVEVDEYVITAREQVLYGSGTWIGKCVRDRPTPGGTNELQVVLPIDPGGSVASAWFRLEHGDEAVRACVEERLLGLRFAPPGPDGGEVWFTWSWEGLEQRSGDPTYNERARPVAEGASPAIEDCVRRNVGSVEGLNFVQVRLDVDPSGGVAGQEVRAVYANDAMRGCVAGVLDALVFPAPGDADPEVWFRQVVR